MNSEQSKAVFLDRDNTIIEDHEGYINSPYKVKLLPGAAKAIKNLKNLGYKVIIITNQSGVARGLFTENDLQSIHQKIISLLEQEEAFIDDVFYCPHHPEATVEEYKVTCSCRKPLPGMIVEATIKHDLAISECYCIGDSERDIQAGQAAGCKTILIDNDTNQKTSANEIVKNLEKAVKIIINSNS